MHVSDGLRQNNQQFMQLFLEHGIYFSRRTLSKNIIRQSTHRIELNQHHCFFCITITMQLSDERDIPELVQQTQLLIESLLFTFSCKDVVMREGETKAARPIRYSNYAI